MFTYALAEPRHPVASALQSTFIHASLIAGAVWATQAVPTVIHHTDGQIDLTWTTPVDRSHTELSGATSAPAHPEVFHWTIPDTLISEPGLDLHDRPLIDPRTLIPGTSPGLPAIDGVDSVAATTILAESEVDELPMLISAGVLRYPAVLQSSGVEGTVTLTFVIDAEGRVEADGIQVIATTQQGFVPAAKEAVLTSRFRPARKHHLPVRVRVRQVISFRQ